MVQNFKSKLKKLKHYLTTPKKDNKPKLLIVGQDLKFILASVKYLEKYYQIKIDDLTGKNGEISQDSKELLKWADIVFCEWFENYAPWYSNNIGNNQKLFIRCHKYELTRDFYLNTNFENIDGIITVNYLFLEMFANVFSIPREKMFLLNNFVETSIYSSDKTEDYRKNLALVGYSPDYKGYKRALEMLKILKQHDDEFKLYLNGHDWTEMPWLRNNKIMKEYFGDCDNFIEENNLQESVIKRGWSEREEMFSNIGFVLSVSDLESTHLAPIEGAADSTVAAILDWPSAKYIYPKELIFDDTEDMVNLILKTYQNDEKYMDLSKKCKKFAIDEFDEKHFVEGMQKILESDRKELDKNDYTYISLIEFKEKYLDKDNNINEDKLLDDFKNSYIIDDENKIEEILLKNKGKKVKLFLSENIDVSMIKEIYQKYASYEVLIFSLYFFKHMDEVELYYDLTGKFTGHTHLKLK